MTIQQQIKAKLAETGLPHKEIQVYGSQIVITAWSRDAAAKWGAVIAKFAKIKGIIEAIDYDKKNTNTVLRPSTHNVWRVFATI
jgi:hypothetical protein